MGLGLASLTLKGDPDFPIVTLFRVPLDVAISITKNCEKDH